MSIRNAIVADARAVKELLFQLDYPVSRQHLEKQLEAAQEHKDHEILVYEVNKEAVGFISVYFVPSLALYNSLAVINYLAVDEKYLGKVSARRLNRL